MDNGFLFASRTTTGHAPEIAEPSPVFDVMDVFGIPISVGRTLVAGRSTLLMFIRPTCPIFAKLIDVIKSVTAREGVDVVLISDEQDANQCDLLDPHSLDSIRYDMGGMRYVVSTEIGRRFQVSTTPYGVLLDAQGTISVKARCTSSRHVESLFQTRRTGYYSLHGYCLDVSRLPTSV